MSLLDMSLGYQRHLIYKWFSFILCNVANQCFSSYTYDWCSCMTRIHKNLKRHTSAVWASTECVGLLLLADLVSHLDKVHHIVILPLSTTNTIVYLHQVIPENICHSWTTTTIVILPPLDWLVTGTSSVSRKYLPLLKKLKVIPIPQALWMSKYQYLKYTFLELYPISNYNSHH